MSVGNETQVFWSDHKTDLDLLIGYVRKVRSATKVPVTVADDFNFWNKPESQRLGRELDFIVTHIHALWGGLPIERAMKWTDRIYTETVQHHPRRVVVVGEAGWATQKHVEGRQARLIKGGPERGEPASLLPGAPGLGAPPQDHDLQLRGLRRELEGWRSPE